MTTATADHRLGHLFHSQGAKGVYFDLSQQSPTATHPRLKHHVGAGIGPQDGRHRAGFAQVRSPRLGFWVALDQTTFLLGSPPVKIFVVELALCTRWCSHNLANPTEKGTQMNAGFARRSKETNPRSSVKLGSSEFWMAQLLDTDAHRLSRIWFQMINICVYL